MKSFWECTTTSAGELFRGSVHHFRLECVSGESHPDQGKDGKGRLCQLGSMTGLEPY